MGILLVSGGGDTVYTLVNSMVPMVGEEMQDGRKANQDPQM